MPNKMIVVSDELKVAMDEFNQQINWSEVAREAFAARVDLLRLKGTGKMEQAGIARLRAQRDQVQQFGRAEGHSHGKMWALNEASYDDLRRVAALDFDGVADDEHAQLLLYGAMFDDDEARSVDWPNAGDYFERHVGERHPLLDRVIGFVDGVNEVNDAI